MQGKEKRWERDEGRRLAGKDTGECRMRERSGERKRGRELPSFSPSDMAIVVQSIFFFFFFQNGEFPFLPSF